MKGDLVLRWGEVGLNGGWELITMNSKQGWISDDYEEYEEI